MPRHIAGADAVLHSKTWVTWVNDIVDAGSKFELTYL